MAESSRQRAGEEITALDAYGVAIMATVIAREQEYQEGAQRRLIAFDGLPGLTASYIAYCQFHADKPLPSRYLLTDVLFHTGSAPVELRYDQHGDGRKLLEDVTNQQHVEGRLKEDAILPRHILEIPPANEHGQNAVYRFKLYPTARLGELAHSYSWANVQLPPNGRHAHILHLSEDIMVAMHHMNMEKLEYAALHPTAIAFFALDVVAATGVVKPELFHLCLLLRLIWTFESEAAAQGLEGYWLAAQPWYHCLATYEHVEELEIMEEGLAKLEVEELHDTLASWEVKKSGGSRREVRQQYRSTFEAFATIVKNTVAYRKSHHIMLGQAYRYPFLSTEVRRPSLNSVASHSSMRSTTTRRREPRVPSMVAELPFMERDYRAPRRNLHQAQPSIPGFPHAHPGTPVPLGEDDPYDPSPDELVRSALDEDPFVPGRKDSTAASHYSTSPVLTRNNSDLSRVNSDLHLSRADSSLNLARQTSGLSLSQHSGLSHSHHSTQPMSRQQSDLSASWHEVEPPHPAQGVEPSSSWEADDAPMELKKRKKEQKGRREQAKNMMNRVFKWPRDRPASSEEER
ncbi:hypothetical protein JCM10450v2_002401 [Rhodotorula kratochvilovae]